MLEMNHLQKKRKALQISQENGLMIHWSMRIWIKYREWEVQWKLLEQPDLCALLNRGHVAKNYHWISVIYSNHKLETMLDQSFKWVSLIAVDAAQ